MIDYHVHLWPHSERAHSREHRLDQLGRYCETASANGVAEIALTEHFFRFRSAADAVGKFWLQDPNEELGAQVAAYFDHHATADLDDYVEAVLDAKRAGLPVVLGLEVDYYRGQMDTVEAFLAGYPFDVLLGSVHWVGNWMFDDLENEITMHEWDRRGTEDAWRSYFEALEELAATRTCDVFAHPDLIKLTGRRPSASAVEECHDRLVEAAVSSGMAAELSSAGWRKPVNEAYPTQTLLAKFAARGVPLTTASDSHGAANVAHRASELSSIARQAGYRSLQAFRGRVGHEVALEVDVAGLVEARKGIH